MPQTYWLRKARLQAEEEFIFACMVFFSLQTRFKKGEVQNTFLHTTLGYFFNKHLRGALFMLMREKILNLAGSTSTSVHRSVLWQQILAQ